MSEETSLFITQLNAFYYNSEGPVCLERGSETYRRQNRLEMVGMQSNSLNTLPDRRGIDSNKAVFPG